MFTNPTEAAQPTTNSTTTTTDDPTSLSLCHFSNPAIQQSSNPAIRQSSNPAIQQSSNPAIQQSGPPQSGNPAIQQSGNLAIRQSSNPAIPHILHKHAISLCKFQTYVGRYTFLQGYPGSLSLHFSVFTSISW
jgi:hypothetical protein